jgi:RimJ/RimL family protein N-acetyltransferase
LIHSAFVTGIERDMLSKWVADLIWPGKGRDFGNCQTMAVLDEETLICGIVFHNFEPDSGVIEISAASTSSRWLTRETLRKMFAYPFEECGVQAVIMRCDPDDAALRRMLTAYGFEMYVIPRLRGRDKDENVFILTDDNWASNKFNRKRG